MAALMPVLHRWRSLVLSTQLAEVHMFREGHVAVEVGGGLHIGLDCSPSKVALAWQGRVGSD